MRNLPDPAKPVHPQTIGNVDEKRHCRHCSCPDVCSIPVPHDLTEVTWQQGILVRRFRCRSCGETSAQFGGHKYQGKRHLQLVEVNGAWSIRVWYAPTVPA